MLIEHWNTAVRDNISYHSSLNKRVKQVKDFRQWSTLVASEYTAISCKKINIHYKTPEHIYGTHYVYDSRAEQRSTGWA